MEVLCPLPLTANPSDTDPFKCLVVLAYHVMHQIVTIFVAVVACAYLTLLKRIISGHHI